MNTDRTDKIMLAFIVVGFVVIFGLFSWIVYSVATTPVVPAKDCMVIDSVTYCKE